MPLPTAHQWSCVPPRWSSRWSRGLGPCSVPPATCPCRTVPSLGSLLFVRVWHRARVPQEVFLTPRILQSSPHRGTCHCSWSPSASSASPDPGDPNWTFKSFPGYLRQCWWPGLVVASECSPCERLETLKRSHVAVTSSVGVSVLQKCRAVVDSSCTTAGLARQAPEQSGPHATCGRLRLHVCMSPRRAAAALYFLFI